MNTITITGTELTNRIEAALDSIRPYLEADGGNVRVLEYTPEHILKLEFVGACAR
jgi:Fe-S cluster biogenesis protein NfuA